MVEDIKYKGLIEILDDANTHFDEYEQVLIRTSYLQNLTEDIIYQTLGHAIRQDNSQAFDNFSQEHRDAYIRLKLRGIYNEPRA
jgi:hypothetical protein